ncbi:hypothetical protein BVC80_177g2 [Macleaya cordata]|uniref:Uncharacterized protein n=1 Tax=Macleaya cordata TaxID=56857 RepID=A0A200R031_MACCD|nr:hypothetical protein BVC80_177g2 [Macleaya cordata]
MATTTPDKRQACNCCFSLPEHKKTTQPLEDSLPSVVFLYPSLSPRTSIATRQSWKSFRRDDI